MRHCFELIDHSRQAKHCSLSPLPVSVHSYRASSPKISSALCGRFLLQRLFSCAFAAAFCLRGFFCRCFISCCLFRSRASAAFCRLQLSLPLSLSAAAFSAAAFFSSFCFGFQQLQLPLSFLLQLQLLLPLPLSSSVPQRLPRLFCASAAALAASASAFSLRLQPLSSLLLPQL